MTGLPGQEPYLDMAFWVKWNRLVLFRPQQVRTARILEAEAESSRDAVCLVIFRPDLAVVADIG